MLQCILMRNRQAIHIGEMARNRGPSGWVNTKGWARAYELPTAMSIDLLLTYWDAHPLYWSTKPGI